MKMGKDKVGFLIAFLLLSGCGKLDYCNLAVGALNPETRAGAKCAILEVPLSRVYATGVTLELPVVSFYPPTPSSKSPLVYLNGGPGFSSVPKANIGERLASLLNREVIFIQQRGTYFTGPVINNRSQLPFLNTIESAEDIAQLSKNLGRKLAIWGSSYGTLLAQRLVQRHPEAVDTLVLEGSLPSDQPTFGLKDKQDEEVVLKRFSDWVKKKWAEQNLTPSDIDPQEDFKAVTALLANSFAQLGITDKTPYEVDYYIQVARNIPDFQLPLALSAYNIHHNKELEASAEVIHQIINDLSTGFSRFYTPNMAFGTNCSDQYQFWSESQINAQINNSGLPANLLNQQKKSELSSLRICQNLLQSPSGYKPEEFSAIAQSDVPTLFLIGMLDTQTPAEWAQPQNFSNAQVVRGACIGHSFFQTSSLWGILKSFLSDPAAPVSTEAVEKYCARPLKQPQL